MYIELCGTPGCGKTYLQEKFKENLTQYGYKIRDLNCKKSDTFNESFFIKKYNGVIRRIQIFASIKIIKERKAIRKYIKANPIEDESRIFYHMLLNEMRKIKIAQYSKYDIILGNEGIVQSMTSLSHSKVMQTDAFEMIDSIDNYFYSFVPTIIFYCYVNQDVNIQRLKNRNKSGDRFLFSEKEDIKNALSVKEKNILFILKRIKNVKIIPINISNADDALLLMLEQLEEKICF